MYMMDGSKDEDEEESDFELEQKVKSNRVD